MVLIRTVIEYNDSGFLVHAENYCGAFARGKTGEEALGKLRGEVESYTLWAAGERLPDDGPTKIVVVQEKASNLEIGDADSDVLFSAEKLPLSQEEYVDLKSLAIRSARDFERLYRSIPDKNRTTLKQRQTFYGPIPRTAQEMYRHTNDVTSYYAGEIGVKVNNLPNIVENRLGAFECIESRTRFLDNTVYAGQDGEEWSLRKVLRRFIWHDRIHAKAMYRTASNRKPVFFSSADPAMEHNT